MVYPIERKLVVAVSSSALFDLSESNKVFVDEGPLAYKEFQKKNLDKPLPKGVAFPFIRRFLSINTRFPERMPVEVVLLSKNSVMTGERVFRTIKHYELDISRAAFLEGASPYPYIADFNASIFLSANEDDVLAAIQAGHPAGVVLPSNVVDKADDLELRIAFDFDGVIADDEAEAVFKAGDLRDFQDHEQSNVSIPHNPGPLADLFKKISFMQKLEDKEIEKDSDYKRIINTAIVTARSAPSHERVIHTLESWGVSPNKTFFLGGVEKSRILRTLRPHIFFDDQLSHLKSDADDIPMVHVPFGIANKNDV